MSSKRAAAKEWKRKRNQQKMVFRLSVAAICLVILMGIGYLAWDSFNRSYVMTFNGNRIPTAEAQFFFMGGIMGTPREQAAADLSMFLLMEEAATRHNVGLTAEERQELSGEVQETRDFFDMFGVSISRLSDTRITELMGMDLMVNRLAEIYGADVEIDEEEIVNALFNYTIFNRHEFIEMDLLIHESSTMEDAINAFGTMQEADSMEEINEIILENIALRRQITGIEPDENEDTEVEMPRLTIQQLASDQSINPGIIMDLAGLFEGDVSSPVEIGGLFYVFVVESMTEPPMEEVEADFRERFAHHQRVSAFEEIALEWREAADIEINQRGLDSL